MHIWPTFWQHRSSEDTQVGWLWENVKKEVGNYEHTVEFLATFAMWHCPARWFMHAIVHSHYCCLAFNWWGCSGLPEFEIKFSEVLTSSVKFRMLKPLPQLTRFWLCVPTLETFYLQNNESNWVNCTNK